MGGYGSTRWDFHNKATTVEDCRVLDIFNMTRKEAVLPSVHRFGVWAWYRGDKQVSKIGYEVKTGETAGWLRLHYTFTERKEDMDYHVILQTTPCHYGGCRWWFLCPLSKNGRSCLRRVAKLYLPPGGIYFGCRHCYELTYTSCQESDKRISHILTGGLLNAEKWLQKGASGALLILKALERDEKRFDRYRRK